MKEGKTGLLYQKKIVVPEKDNMGCFTSIMVFSLFPSLVIILMTFRFLDLTIAQLFQLICLILALSFFIPINLYRKKLTMSFYEYIIFNLISFTPVLLASVFFLNVVFKGHSYVESYTIIDVIPDKKSYTYILEDGKYQDKEYLRTIHSNNFPNITGSSRYSIYFQKGLFGIRVIDKKLAH